MLITGSRLTLDGHVQLINNFSIDIALDINNRPLQLSFFIVCSSLSTLFVLLLCLLSPGCLAARGCGLTKSRARRMGAPTASPDVQSSLTPPIKWPAGGGRDQRPPPVRPWRPPPLRSEVGLVDMKWTEDVRRVNRLISPCANQHENDWPGSYDVAIGLSGQVGE